MAEVTLADLQVAVAVLDEAVPTEMPEDVWYEDEEDFDEEDVEFMGQEIKLDVSSAKKGFDFLRNVATIASGMTYAILSKEDTGLQVTLKMNKPCLGELRPYGAECNPLQKDTRGQDRKPGDLPHGFPAGEILGIAVPCASKSYSTDMVKVVQDFWNSSESPFRGVLKPEDVDIIKYNGSTFGYVWKQTDLLPSNIIAFLMGTRNVGSWAGYVETIDGLRQGAFEELRFYLPLFGYVYAYGSHKGKFTLTGGPDQYALNLLGSNLSRFFAGNPFDIDGGVTLRQRGAYNRPNIHATFGQGYKNEWMGKAPGGSPYVELEYIVEHIQKAMAEPQAEQWSAKGDDPTVANS